MERRIAVLIDGDNAQPGHIGAVLKESVRYGVVTIKRIYADFTDRHMEGWKQRLSTHAIQPIQQFRNTVGKNATDSAMIIDAMDILYSDHVGGFVIVSSDSDYTKLAIRLREAGMEVVGIGKHQTPKPFVNACNEFRFVENLAIAEERSQRRTGRKQPVTETDDAERGSLDLVTVITDAVEMAEADDDWVDLGTIANNLKKLYPDFDPRTYGNRRLSKLIESHSEAFRMRRDRENNSVTVRLAATDAD
jgi:uncharacterized LabA/DUF88 family protein/Fe-S-cluster formation regulator IscX/YfhJ